MSTLKRRPRVPTRSLLILAGYAILAGCAAGPPRPAANLPRPDGRYDNHAYLVDSSRMNLSQVVSSIVVLATRTDFELPDGTRLGTELVGSGVVVGGRYILTVEHAVS